MNPCYTCFFQDGKYEFRGEIYCGKCFVKATNNAEVNINDEIKNEQ